jgi:hypothetical protein
MGALCTRKPSDEGMAMCRLLGFLLAGAVLYPGTPLPAHANDSVAPPGRQLIDPLTTRDHLPLRLDWDTQIGGFDEGKRQTIAIEPVFSFGQGGGRWVSRTLLPLVRLEGVDPDDRVQTGIGDLQQTLYYVPASVARDDGFHWGVGASLRAPTASDNALGEDAWALGPAFAAAWVGRRWSWGAQVQHLQAIAGDSDDDADGDYTLLAPFAARDLSDDWSVGVQVDAAYDWQRDRIKGPLTLFARRTGEAFAFDAGFRYWIDGPTEEPEWGLRLGLTWILD